MFVPWEYFLRDDLFCSTEIKYVLCKVPAVELYSYISILKGLLGI